MEWEEDIRDFEWSILIGLVAGACSSIALFAVLPVQELLTSAEQPDKFEENEMKRMKNTKFEWGTNYDRDET